MKTQDNNSGQGEQKSWAQQNQEATNAANSAERKITDGVSQSGLFDKDAPRNPASAATSNQFDPQEKDWDSKRAAGTDESQNKGFGNEDVDTESEQEKKFPGYMPYPKNEDIYVHDKKEEDIDPETRLHIPDADVEAKNYPVSERLESDIDLDVPGAELDDADEAIGHEDEENNYYSLGGDNHEDLEEDRNEVQ